MKDQLLAVAQIATDSIRKARTEYAMLYVVNNDPHFMGETNTNGVRAECGEFWSGRRRFVLELWFEHFANAERPHFWYGVTSTLASINSLIDDLGERTRPVKVLREHDLEPLPGRKIRYRQKRPFPEWSWEKTIAEYYYEESYLGVYWRRDELVKKDYRIIAEAASTLWKTLLRTTQIDEEITEGTLQFQSINVRRRSKRLRDAAIDRYSTNNSLECHSCGLTAPIAGPRAIIELHHREPISSYDVLGNKKELQKAVDLLSPLCPTCHRLAHRSKTAPLPIEKVRQLQKQLFVSRHTQ